MKRHDLSSTQSTLFLIARWLLPWCALALAALPAASPYLRADFPRTNDAPLHLYRALTLDRLIRDGYLWPRWSPDLVHGYGYPVFNFFSPLAHYSVAFYHLAGFSLTMAYRLAVVSQFIIAAWTAYLLARDRFGPAGGWVAAIAYTYSPYLLYDAHVRGGLAETLALALLPLLFFALRRATRRWSCWKVGGAMIFGALTLIHTPSVVQLALPVGIWLLGLGWEMGWRKLWGPLAALAGGALLVTGFWLPVLIEQRYVQSGLAIARGYRFESNFFPLDQLWAFPRFPADPYLLNPPVVRSLPQVAVFLAFLLWVWRWRRAPARRVAGVWVGMGVLCTVLILPQAIPVWRAIPLLELTQFPWRLLGCVSLAGAMTLAAVFAGWKRDASRGVWLSVVVVLLSIAATPWLHPPREPLPEAPTLVDLHAFEHPPAFIGTTTLGEFLPIWVEALPDTTALRQQLAAEGQADRLVAPAGVEVQSLRVDPMNARYRLRATEPATLHYRQFYFPGWRVMLDGRPVTIRPSVPHGLITFDVPAGDFTLEVIFGATPMRRVGAVLSALTAVGLALFGILALRSPPTHPKQPSRSLPVAWMGVIVLCVWGIHVGLAVIETPLRRPALGSEGWRGPGEPLMRDMIGELRLLAYEQSASHVRADESVTLTLYWQALRPLGVVYDFAVDLVDERGLKWNAPYFERPANWRWMPGTDDWPLDGYLMDTRRLYFVMGAPPGDYHIQVAVVRRDTQQTVAVHTFGKVRVTEPLRGDHPLPRELEPGAPTLDARWQLVGSAIDRESAVPGEIVRITLLARVGDAPTVGAEENLRLQFISSDGEVLLSRLRRVAPQYPPTRWRPGEWLRTQVLLRVPASAQPGEHTWEVQFADQPRQPIGSLEVLDPERLWNVPPPDWQVDVSFEGRIRLVGADVSSADVSFRPGQALDVTLIWQALAKMEDSYRVFVHLMDAEGQLVAQSDGKPAEWARPTPGWLPGEFVLDPHSLMIPPDVEPGRYQLSVGLYTPDGARLSTSAGDDAVLLYEFVVATP